MIVKNGFELFLFDCVGGFWGIVVGYLVDVFYFVDDLGCDVGEEVVGKLECFCCYVVGWCDCVEG